MIKPDYLPENYDRIVVVDNLRDVFDMQMKGRVNCVLHPRQLEGDFDGLAKFLDMKVASCSISPLYLSHGVLQKLIKGACLKKAESRAWDAIEEDLKIAQDHNYQVNIRIVQKNAYERYVYKFHADGNRMHPLYQRVMSIYNGATTEFLCNQDAVLEKDEGFFEPKPDAKIYTFKPGDIWQHRCMSRAFNNAERAFIHRAPLRNAPVPSLVLVCGL